MTQIVYADVLFVTNMLITYLLLRLVAIFFSARKSAFRMILASIIGGAFSFYILVPEQNFLITMFIKFSFSVAIVFAGFKMQSSRQFLKLILGFYSVSFGFAGVMIATWILIKPKGMLINNSTVYFNISVPLLIISCVGCYVVISLALRVISKRMPRGCACDATITVGDKSVTCRAMIDTGNSLTDLFTGFPVIIAEYNSVERLIPYDYRAFYSKKGELPQTLDSFSKRVRTIPYEAVGNGGVLPSFKPDYVVIKSKGRNVKIDNVIVGVEMYAMSKTDYQVLLNSSMSEYY